jgi:hypothetical protein
VCSARGALLADGVRTVVVVRQDDRDGRLAATAARVLGGQGRELQGVELWDVTARLRCTAGRRTVPVKR